MEPPSERRRSGFWRVAGWFLLALFLHGIIDPHGPDPVGWSVQMLILGWAGRSLYRGIRDGRIPVQWLVRLGEQTLDRVAGRFERIDGEGWIPELTHGCPTIIGVIVHRLGQLHSTPQQTEHPDILRCTLQGLADLLLAKRLPGERPQPRTQTKAA